MNPKTNRLIAYILVPSASFFAIKSGLDHNWFECGFTVLFGAGMSFSFFGKKVENTISEPLSVSTSKKIRNKLKEIEDVGMTIPRPNTVRKLKTFLNIGNQIANDLDEDPDDAPAVQNWSNSFLDETILIVRSYQLMLKSKPDSNSVNQQLVFDEFLNEITRQTESLLNDLKTNNTDNLNISLSVMMTRLKNEGIS